MGKVTLINGIKQGYFEEYHENGKIKETGYYLDNKKNGSFYKIDDRELFIEEGSYKNGILSGDFKKYRNLHNQKNLILQCSYHKGKLEGRYIKYSPITGFIEVDTKYSYGIEIGPRKSYYQNGNLGSTRYLDDRERVKNGIFKSYDDKGRIYHIGTNKNYKRDGFFEYFNEFGEVRERFIYKNDKKNGLWERFGCNRSKRNYGVLDGRGTYKNDKKNGLFEYFNEGDLWLRESYKNDKKDGVIETFKKGFKSSKETYKNGKKDGVSIYYDSKGKIQRKITFKNDKENGFSWFYENGKLKRRKEYKNGVLLN